MRSRIYMASLLAIGAITVTASSVRAEEGTDESSCALYRDAFVSYQLEPIGRALADRFGDSRLFMVDDVSVRNLGPQYSWEATLRVTTFEGPHNPPYREYRIRIAKRGSEDPIIEEVREMTPAD